MNVLFDKNVPKGVLGILARHQVETSRSRGWSLLQNGRLLQMAETHGFDVMVTADQNIVYQQNLKGRKIALVVLGSNIWELVRNHAGEIRYEVDTATPGSYAFIKIPAPPKGRKKR